MAKLIESIDEWVNIYQEWKSNGRIIGYVPTMGALHQGHLSLVNRATNECDAVVVSIFVNPTQFNDPKDYLNYPSTLTQDIELLGQTSCDIVLAPSVQDVYPNGINDRLSIDLGFLDKTLEGINRPGHYSGVVTVLNRFFSLIPAQYVYMGLKDYQQVMVVKKLCELHFKSINIVGCPTVREPNGLAMSSRNQRLNPTDRARAKVIYQALSSIKENKYKKSPIECLEIASDIIKTENDIEIEYLEIRNSLTLEPISLETWQDIKYVALVAVWLSGVRLIDNLEL